VFKLSAKDCAELFNEGTIYYYRLVNFFRIEEWVRAERDTARNLRLIEFVKRYAEHEEDRLQLEQSRTDVTRINAVARAMVLFRRARYGDALRIVRETIGGVDALMNKVEGRTPEPKKMAAALLESVRFNAARKPV
jgi:hypothetical protein